MNSARACLAVLGGLALAAVIAIPVGAAAGPAPAPARLAPVRVTPARLTPGQVAPAPGTPARLAAWRPAAPAEPDFTARVTARVRCGTFAGTVLHGGDGSVLFPAFLTVTGRVSSHCAATVTARVGYKLDFVPQGPFTLGKAGPDSAAAIRRLHRQTRVATSYQDIFIQVCSGGRRLTCGAPVHV